MTPRERLEAMLARSEKATPGPWEKDYGGTFFHIKSIAEHPQGRTPTVARYDTAVLTIDLEEQECNGGFIAAARTDLPALAKCLLAVMDKLGETKHEFSIRSIFADEILDIINRELGE